MERAPGVEVHIEELVLHGFDPRHRLAIAGAVERELASLIRSGVPVERWNAGGPRLDGGSFELAHGAAPAVVGASIAGAIGRGLGMPEGGRR